MDHAVETREKRPTFVKGLIFLLILMLMGAGLAAFALSQRSEAGPKVPAAGATPAPISARVATVKMADAFQRSERFSGLATPRRTSQLGFQTGGLVASMSADVGERVTKGRTLARLDTRSLRAQLASAEAVVEEARASHALAMNTVERQRTLKNKGHVSQQAVDEAEAQAATALARIDAAKAQADTLRVQIDLARIDAPFDGAVTNRMVDEGAIATPGAPVLEIVESGALEARIGLPAELAATLAPGQAYTIETDAGPVQATLRATTGVIGRGDRTVATVFDIVEDAGVPAGAVVRIGLDRTLDERGAWAPISALAESERGLWSVYVAQPAEGGGFSAERRLVEIVHAENDRAFVRGALSDGDRIIVDGLKRITPGQAVAPIDTSVAANLKEG